MTLVIPSSSIGVLGSMATTRKSLASRAGAVARKVVAKKSPDAASSTGTKKTPAKKAAAKKTPAKKAAAKKTAPRTAAKKTAAKKTAAKKTPVAKKSPAKKTAAKKSATTTSAAPATPTKKAPVTPVKKAPDAQAPATKAPVKKTAAKKSASPANLVVLEQEDPWTAKELKQVRQQLLGDVDRLGHELHDVEEDLAGMIENSGEGAGHDQADVGSASFERDQEMVIVNNARDMLEQSQHALERIADGSYGRCEICGNAIGKNRLMAFPRATLCLTCKQREERR